MGDNHFFFAYLLGMQRRIVVSKGKSYLVNAASNDDGVGAGFAVGQLTLKSISDDYWYIITASGSYNNVIAFVSQSQLTSFGTSSYYDINYPYQLLSSTNGNTYAVYLSGSVPSASLVISQSVYTGSAYPKPYLLLQNKTDMNYYSAYLSSSVTTTSLIINQTMVSQSWVNPIY